MRARKKISQREAVRNRRELKRLRDFVARVSGPLPNYDLSLCSVDLPREVGEKARGIAWGARNQVVFLVRVYEESAQVVALRIPEAP